MSCRRPSLLASPCPQATKFRAEAPLSTCRRPTTLERQVIVKPVNGADLQAPGGERLPRRLSLQARRPLSTALPLPPPCLPCSTPSITDYGVVGVCAGGLAVAARHRLCAVHLLQPGAPRLAPPPVVQAPLPSLPKGPAGNHPVRLVMAGSVQMAMDCSTLVQSCAVRPTRRWPRQCTAIPFDSAPSSLVHAYTYR